MEQSDKNFKWIYKIITKKSRKTTRKICELSGGAENAMKLHYLKSRKICYNMSVSTWGKRPCTSDMSHHCWAEGKEHLPWPAGNAPPHAAQAALCHLHHKDTLLAQVHIVIHSLLRSFSPKLLSTQLVPCAYCCLKLFVTRGRTFYISLLNLMRFLFYPVLQSVQLSLNGSTPLWCINCSPQFHTICNLAEDAICRIIQVINESAEQYWPPCDLCPGRTWAADHTPLGPFV